MQQGADCIRSQVYCQNLTPPGQQQETLEFTRSFFRSAACTALLAHHIKAFPVEKRPRIGLATGRDVGVSHHRLDRIAPLQRDDQRRGRAHARGGLLRVAHAQSIRDRAGRRELQGPLRTAAGLEALRRAAGSVLRVPDMRDSSRPSSSAGGPQPAAGEDWYVVAGVALVDYCAGRAVAWHAVGPAGELAASLSRAG